MGPFQAPACPCLYQPHGVHSELAQGRKPCSSQSNTKPQKWLNISCLQLTRVTAVTPAISVSLDLVFPPCRENVSRYLLLLTALPDIAKPHFFKSFPKSICTSLNPKIGSFQHLLLRCPKAPCGVHTMSKKTPLIQAQVCPDGLWMETTETTEN